MSAKLLKFILVLLGSGSHSCKHRRGESKLDRMEAGLVADTMRELIVHLTIRPLYNWGPTNIDIFHFIIASINVPKCGTNPLDHLVIRFHRPSGLNIAIYFRESKWVRIEH